MQNAYNLYGEESFQVCILENTIKSETLIREQWYIDNTLDIYNINPLASGTPNMSKETILKRAETMKRKYASGEIESNFKKGFTPWNKGKKQGEVDYSYLKDVKKTISKKVVQKWKNQSEQQRINFPEIYVYDQNYNFLKKFRSSKDLEEWSLTEQNNLPIKGRFKKTRMSKPLKFLCSGNILKSCKTNKPYKDLIFSNKPLHEVIHVEKLGEFRETPEVDNPEPSL